MNFIISIGQNSRKDQSDHVRDLITHNNFSFKASSERWIRHSTHDDSTLIVVGYVTEYPDSIDDLLFFFEECVQTNCHENLKKLSGNFVLIYHSKKTNKVILTADITGCIPLYKIKNNNQIIVTSSIKYASSFSEQNSLNHSAFFASLSLFSLQPSETFLSNVERFDPEQVIELNTETATVERTFKFNFHKLVYNAEYRKLEEIEAAELVKSWLGETTNIIVNNGGATIPLSGGLDSSNIWAAVLRQNDLDHNVSAYTCGHGNYESDESGMVEAWKTNYPEYKYILNTNTFDNLVEYYLQQGNERNPGLVLDRAHHSLFISEHLDHGISSNVITGEGGDELFAGETSSIADLIYSGQIIKARKTLTALKNSYDDDDFYYGKHRFALGQLLKPKGRILTQLKLRLRPPKIRPWLNPEKLSEYIRVVGNDNRKQGLLVRPGNFASQAMLRRYCYIQNSTFLGEYFHTFSERNMFVFHPLLEYRMLSLSYSLRPELLVANGFFKNILRLSLKDISPQNIVNNRTKHNNATFYGDIADTVSAKYKPMSEWSLVKNGYIDPTYLNEYRGEWLFIHLYCHETLFQNYDN